MTFAAGVRPVPNLPEGMTEIPRRLNMSELRQDFRHLAGRLEIFLDGQLMHDVIAYDTDAGSLERYAHDEAGNPIIGEDGERLATEMVTGNVRVQLRARA